ncbi:MAG: hypothetical protein LBI57_03445 [Helicobacteraceae bacterium]|jgi:hypothetical protein|nr:hypothetical protein [Helicobacteraceae bacterium]
MAIQTEIASLPPAPDWQNETPAIAEEKALAFTAALPPLADELNAAINEINNRESGVIETANEANEKASDALATANAAKTTANAVSAALADVVYKSGDQSIAGVKTFADEIVLPSKSAAAGDNPTAPATEAQLYNVNLTAKAATAAASPLLVAGNVLAGAYTASQSFSSTSREATLFSARVRQSGQACVKLCSSYSGSCHYLWFYCNGAAIRSYGRTSGSGDASVTCLYNVNAGDVFSAYGCCMCGSHVAGIALYLDSCAKYLPINIIG